MRRSLIALAGICLVATAAQAGVAPPPPGGGGKPECNWGELTRDAIANGFDQGGHASDPSDDGHGPGSRDEPRVGLANVVDRGNLDATCQLIEGAVD